MDGHDKVNLDTSVLVNYLYASIPGDVESSRGSVEIIDDDAITTVVGGKATDEFVALCERRHELYADVVEFLNHSDGEIFEYDPQGRDIHTNSRDEDIFRKDIQMSWHDKDKREQLSLLRRMTQEIELYQVRVPEQVIDERYPRQENDDFLDALTDRLDIGHDRDILVDAAELADKESATLLVALDSDITSDEHQSVFSELLDEFYGDADLFDIEAADTYASL